MAGLDLPDHCTECGSKAGWYLKEDTSLFVTADGELRIREAENTRWGKKIQFKCNNRDCDAVVNIYLNAEVVNNGDIESTGAKELIPRLKENDLLPELIEKECRDCGEGFVTEPRYRIGGHGGIVISGQMNCGCGGEIRGSSMFQEEVTRIPPEEFENALDIVPKNTENIRNDELQKKGDS